MAGSDSQPAPAAQLCLHLPSSAGACTATLEAMPSEFREPVKIQLLRLRSWQRYIFFPPRLQGKTIRRDKIKCFLKECVIRRTQCCLVRMSCEGAAGFGVDYVFRAIKSKSKATVLHEGKPARVSSM